MFRTTLTLLCLTGLLVAQQKDREYTSPWELLVAEHDKDKDGKITQSEYTRGKDRFARLDSDGDGVITKSDLSRGDGRRRGRGRGRDRRSRGASPAAPKQGAAAPDFTLKTLDGKKKVRLSSFKGKKPVALIFGSYT